MFSHKNVPFLLVGSFRKGRIPDVLAVFQVPIIDYLIIERFSGKKVAFLVAGLNL